MIVTQPLPVLQDYQKRDIIRTRNAFRKHRKVLYVSPTGSGKTTLFCEVCRLAVERGGRVLVVVHRKELIRQVSNRLGVFGIEHGVTASGYKQNLDFPVQVSMVRRAPKLLKQFFPSLVIVDEAHHSVAGSWEKTLAAAPLAKVLGVTATPARLDGRGLGEAFDELVLGPSVRELTDAGHLVPAHIYAPSEPDLSSAGQRGGDFKNEEIAAAMERASLTGDAIHHYKKLCKNARAVAFCVNVEHAQKTCQAFNESGIPSGLVLGEQDEDEREKAVADLESGALRVICSVDVISEGFDVPAVEAVLLLRPTASLALYLQQLGRALRPSPGKNFAVVLDHAGNALRHGFPDDDFLWSLEGGVTRKTPSDLLQLKRCSSCLLVYRSGSPLLPLLWT